MPAKSRIARAAMWFAAALGFSGIGVTILLTLTGPTLAFIGGLSLFLGVFCMGVAAAIYYDADAAQEQAPPAKSIAAISPTTAPQLDPMKPSTTAPPHHNGRHFVSISPVDLIEFFKSHTTAQANRLVEPYIGKWMELHGTIRDVEEKFIELEVSGDARKVVPFVCFFDKEWRDRFAILRRGELVRVVGAILAVRPGAIALEHCELVP